MARQGKEIYFEFEFACGNSGSQNSSKESSYSDDSDWENLES